MLKPLPICDILNYHFIIPPYQRGYRWDDNQVKDLLNDLKHFATCIAQRRKPNAPDPGYYCLQPIAVVAKDPQNPQNKTFYVVDGQQRLTTIYLILQFLRPGSDFESSPIFSLEMEARKIEQNFIDKESYKHEDIDYTCNIDNFYLKTAYDTITEWFNKEEIAYRRLFRQMLFERPLTDEDADSANNVRFIWYQMENKTALEAFRRLNYGKIPLTSTELIKALMLSSTTSHDTNSFRKSSAYRRAVEWDSMEHALHNPYLWSMLSEDTDNASSTSAHIDIILDFVADDLNKEITAANNGKPIYARKDKTLLASDPDIRDYFNYYVINHIISKSKENEDQTEEIWKRIRDAFNLITNWYDDRNWYHLIGLLRILPNAKSRKDTREFVREVYNLATGNAGTPLKRPEFTENLRKKIKEIIELPNDKSLSDINYNDDAEAIRRILKALNVKTSLDDPTENARFDFNLFDKYAVTSLEHIHPQNITTNDAHTDFINWFEQRCRQFSQLSPLDFANAAIRHMRPEDIENLTTDQKIERGAELKKNVALAIDTIRSLASDQKSYKKQNTKDALAEPIKIFDSLFGDLTGISRSDLDSISNMALVDKDTNSALQNYLLDRKRQLLMERHALGMRCKKNEIVSGGTYALPATRMVFNKEYSRQSPGDMRLWRPEDRECYMAAIINAYTYFTK